MKTFNIQVIYYFEDDDFDIAASTRLNPSDFPSSNVISTALFNDLSDQEIADYESFVETIEDLLVEYYDFEIVYSSESKYLSHYYVLLAKDNDGNIIFKFRLKLRVSNHLAKRTPNQKKRKAEERKAVSSYLKGKKVKPMNKDMIVNNTKYSSYYDAYVHIDDEIQKALKIMKNR